MQALKLIRTSLQKIGKTAAEQDITGDMSETAIGYLNNMMFAKDHMGLGYTEVVNTTDEITTPAYSWKWMENQLGLEMADEFGTLDSYITIQDKAEEGWATVLLSKQRIPAPQLSGNVPYGSGNKRPGGYSANYYPETDSGILTETNQEIVVEDGTT